MLTETGDHRLDGELIAGTASGLDEGRANVDGDPRHVLPLRGDGKGADGVREREDEAPMDGLDDLISGQLCVHGVMPVAGDNEYTDSSTNARCPRP